VKTLVAPLQKSVAGLTPRTKQRNLVHGKNGSFYGAGEKGGHPHVATQTRLAFGQWRERK
jgi:hypothetical protein